MYEFEELDHKEQTCAKKIKHESYKEAHKARKQMIQRIGDPGRKLQIYLCKICNQYHLGTPTKTQIQKQKIHKKELQRKQAIEYY